MTRKKKTDLITGVSRGLGYQTAKLMAKKNIHILGIARTVGGLESLSDEINECNGFSTMIPLDIADDKQLIGLKHALSKQWQKIDYFIHLAAVAVPLSPITSISIKDFDRAINTNVRSTLKLLQIVDPFLKAAKNGQALFVDDTSHGKFFAAYAASKAAHREIINSYMLENKRLGPNVTIFKPSPMPTALRAKFFPGEDRNNLKHCLSEAEKLIAHFNL